FNRHWISFFYKKACRLPYTSTWTFRNTEPRRLEAVTVFNTFIILYDHIKRQGWFAFTNFVDGLDTELIHLVFIKIFNQKRCGWAESLVNSFKVSSITFMLKLTLRILSNDWIFQFNIFASTNLVDSFNTEEVFTIWYEIFDSPRQFVLTRHD
ncbi:hypothetical protein DBR06_SOUSAS5510114, partial [Sousa chinensis]